MEKRRFGRTNLEVSVLGFGAAPIGFLEVEQNRVAAILNILLDAGVNLIDTAAGYAGSEELIGKAVSHRREEYVLVSKCGNVGGDDDAPAWSRKLILRTIDESLRKLRTDHLDVMLLHSCQMPTLQDGEALGALLEARDAGKIRHAGYSGDNEEAAYAAGLEGIDVIETSISIVDQANIDNVLPVARQNDIGVIVKRPIANSVWRDLNELQGLYREYARAYAERLQAMNITPAEIGFDGPPASAWPEMALRFTLSQPGVHTAIIGTTNPDNARSNIEIAGKGPLPEAAIARIRKAFEGAEFKEGRHAHT